MTTGPAGVGNAGTAWVVAGVAGSGKTTLGRALAARLGAPLLDLDTATERVLDALGPALWPGGHWNDGAHRELVRPARYATLVDLLRDQVAPHVVLVAPFTLELTGGPEWSALTAAAESREVRVVWLEAEPDLLADRREARADPRDGLAPPQTLAQPTPAVPHVRLDATMPTDEQLAALLGAP